MGPLEECISNSRLGKSQFARDLGRAFDDDPQLLQDAIEITFRVGSTLFANLDIDLPHIESNNIEIPFSESNSLGTSKEMFSQDIKRNVFNFQR